MLHVPRCPFTTFNFAFICPPCVRHFGFQLQSVRPSKDRNPLTNSIKTPKRLLGLQILCALRRGVAGSARVRSPLATTWMPISSSVKGDWFCALGNGRNQTLNCPSSQADLCVRYPKYYGRSVTAPMTVDQVKSTLR